MILNNKCTFWAVYISLTVKRNVVKSYTNSIEAEKLFSGLLSVLLSSTADSREYKHTYIQIFSKLRINN